MKNIMNKSLLSMFKIICLNIKLISFFILKIYINDNFDI